MNKLTKSEQIVILGATGLVGSVIAWTLIGILYAWHLDAVMQDKSANPCFKQHVEAQK